MFSYATLLKYFSLFVALFGSHVENSNGLFLCFFRVKGKEAILVALCS